MNEITKAYIQKCLEYVPTDWPLETKASKLAMYVIENYDEAGIPDLLPELDMGGGYKAQHELDQAVEEAYSWLQGEIRHYLA